MSAAEALPDVVAAYFAAAADADHAAIAGLFTESATVIDDGKTFNGRAEILGWLQHEASQYSYTSELIGSDGADEWGHLVTNRLTGNFPGGVVDLGYTFVLRNGLIQSLSISP